MMTAPISPPDRYAVFGNPVAHSRSPRIHTLFAAACGQHLSYEAIQAPLDDFAGALHAFIAAGGRGANVTVPFKEDAARLAARRTPRADAAGAVNTLIVSPDGSLLGDNTDGVGLVRDLTHNLGLSLAGRSVLLLGAGGAARGTVGPLLACEPGVLTIANRTAAKASDLALRFVEDGPVFGCGYDELAGESYDLVINATSASLNGALPDLPDGLFAPGALAYDMMYGNDTPFLAHARSQGVTHTADGLGMLVEQAAAAFALWRGVQPDTAPVLATLRG